MFAAYLVVVGATILANVVVAVADFVPLRQVVANGAAVGVPRSWLVPLGLLKLAGALGLLLGFFDVPLVDLAAAVGLVAFFASAVALHVRARVFGNIAFPGVFLVLAIASLVLVATH